MKICIFDGSIFFHKAFGVNPADPVGTLTTMIRSALDYHEPDRSIVALDAGRETFRNKIYPAYKGDRKPPQEGYTEALSAMMAVFADFHVESISAPDFEADDIIGTLCAHYPGTERIILSIDKDLMQLVREGVVMWHDGIWIKEEQVWEKFGVEPRCITEVLGLMGDHTDNIPGVVGIGEKTAIKLIQEYGCLEYLYDRLKDITPPRIRFALEHGKESAFLSRKLATINCSAPLD